MKLTDKEFNVVDKLAHSSKMDESWFSITEDENGQDVVYDLEEEESISLKEGIEILNDGITPYDLDSLSSEELKIYKDLLKKLSIS